MVTVSKCWFVLIATAAFALPGCARSLHQASFASAKPIADCGVRNLSHDGDVYFGGQPTAEALHDAQKKGVKVVVNLRSTREVKALDFDEAALVKQLGMEYVAIPITPSTFGPGQADDLKAVLRKTPGPILIHCASSNRVGALWALYLNRHRGVAVDKAIALGRKAGMRSEILVDKIRKFAAQ